MKQKHEHENEAKAKDLGKEAADMAPQDHADEDQDKELFAKMIKQYLGKDDADQEEMEMAHHAYQAHKEDGMDHEAAYEAAGKHLKMAMHIGKKMMQKHEAAPDDKEAPAKDAAPSKDAPSKDMPPKKDDEDHEEKKESHEKHEMEKKHESAYIKLSAENAKLKESLKTFELRDYLDKKLSESKKPNLVTKKFREALGSPKSKEHIDHSFKLFMAAFESQTEEEGSGFVFTEKSTFRASDEKPGTGSMSDCF